MQYKNICIDTQENKKIIGVPERIRTSDLPLRRGLRYPTVPPGREVGGPDYNTREQKEKEMKVTESRSRTDTVSPPPDFESGASTSSAIPAI